MSGPLSTGAAAESDVTRSTPRCPPGEGDAGHGPGQGDWCETPDGPGSIMPQVPGPGDSAGPGSIMPEVPGPGSSAGPGSIMPEVPGPGSSENPGSIMPQVMWPPRIIPIPLDYPYPHEPVASDDVRVALPRCLDRPEELRARACEIERAARIVGRLDDDLTTYEQHTRTQVEGDLSHAIDGARAAWLQGPVTHVQSAAVVATGSLRWYLRTVEDFNATADRLNGEMARALVRFRRDRWGLQQQYRFLRDQARLAIEFFEAKVDKISYWLEQGPTDEALDRFSNVHDNVGLPMFVAYTPGTGEGAANGAPTSQQAEQLVCGTSDPHQDVADVTEQQSGVQLTDNPVEDYITEHMPAPPIDTPPPGWPLGPYPAQVEDSTVGLESQQVSDTDEDWTAQPLQWHPVEGNQASDVVSDVVEGTFHSTDADIGDAGETAGYQQPEATTVTGEHLPRCPEAEGTFDTPVQGWWAPVGPAGTDQA